MNVGLIHEGINLLVPINANETLLDEITALNEVDLESIKPAYKNTFKLISFFLDKYMKACKEVVTRVDLFVCEEEKQVFDIMKDELIGFLMNMHKVMDGEPLPDFIDAITEDDIGITLTMFIDGYEVHVENLKKPLFDQALFRIHRFFYIFNTQRRFQKLLDSQIEIDSKPFMLYAKE